MCPAAARSPQQPDATTGGTAMGPVAETSSRSAAVAGLLGAVMGVTAGQATRASAGPTEGPQDGQGRLPKHRKVCVFSEHFAMPTTPANKALASTSMGVVKAQSLTGDKVWEAAAAAYNTSLGEVMTAMRDFGQPNPGYSFSPIDRALLKKYWMDSSAATIFPRAGIQDPIFQTAAGGGAPHAGAGAGTGTGAGVSPAAEATPAAEAGPRVLTRAEIQVWNGNLLRKECRRRSIRCANTTQSGVIIQKLIDGGWVTE